MKIVVNGYTYDTGPYQVNIGDIVILPTPDFLRDVKGPTWEGPVAQIGSSYTGPCIQILGVKEVSQLSDSSALQQNEPEFPIPDDINALLDEASVAGGPYSAKPLTDRVQLVDTATGKVVREVIWPDAGRWRANLLRNALGAFTAEKETTP